MAEELKGPAFYSYNLQTETKLQIDELIYALAPMDLPLLTGVGADGLPVLPRTPVLNTIFYWMEEEIPLPRATLNEALDNSETGIDVVTGDAVKFAVGDHIRIDDEVMRVTDIDTSTEVLTVTRGALGTTAVIHNTAAEIIGIGTALPEGDIGNGNFQGRDRYSNYTQIWSGQVKVSRTEQVIPKYGVPNELNRQMLARTQHLMLGVEQAGLYGIKHETPATRIRSTGGLASFITSNVDAASTWLTVDTIETQQARAYDNGGMFDMIVARPAHYEALNNIQGSQRVTTQMVEDNRRGRTRAMSVMTEYGEVTLVRDRWVRKTDAFAYNREQFQFRVLQPLITEKLAKTDDTDTYMLVCEGGFQVKGQDHMAKFTTLDLNAALPGTLV
jgi:Family of unknown function (DUF5309)